MQNQPPETNNHVDELFQRIRVRALELQEEGLDETSAREHAWLEERIRQWPTSWGDDLVVIIYGDMISPNREITIEKLGIVISPQKPEKTIFPCAICVLEARVTLSSKTVEGIQDAIRRINILLGASTLVDWGNSSVKWWCGVTHNHNASGLINFTDSYEEFLNATNDLLSLSDPVQQKLQAALYWIREPKTPIQESSISDVLGIYSGYWNAFECLVEAVNILHPQSKISRTEKQAKIDEFVAERSGKLTAEDISKCYLEIVNPSFVGKASHALRICFPNEADIYIEECFRLSDKQNRLYDIRNAIDHGDIDAENLEELIRIESRLSRLWMIVWRMFGRFVQFPAPAEWPSKS